MDTVDAAQRAGLEVCSGGILGLGENSEQRWNWPLNSRNCRFVRSPSTFSTPFRGRLWRNQPPLRPLEVLKTIAVFRFILPDREIRTCGGREVNLRGLQPLMFTAGCTGTMIGNYLTTEGRNPEQDIRDIEDLGLTVAR